MRRVVITGIGIVSCIGNNKEEVLESLKAGKSGIKFNQEYADKGFRSQVSGKPDLELAEAIDKRLWRFMGDAAGYVHLSMEQAIEDSGLEEQHVVNERTGIIVGSGGPSVRNQVLAADIVREKGAPKRIGPFAVPKAMSSTTSATAATNFKIKGVNYSITSACSTSAHCIGAATEQIQWGKQDVMFAGGGEELDWALSALFDAMGAMSSKYNDAPETAARAYDANRDGFVIGSGGGIVVLEELEHAKARGAKIYAEVTGYGATSDGHDMVAPSGEGGERAMRVALETVKGPVTYINTHGTSTPVGDIGELDAIKRVWTERSEDTPHISATKSMTGHSLGATGVQEAIYSLLMMKHNFVCPSINIVDLDPGAEGMPIARQRVDNVEHKTVISNSFGFGGTNCCLAMSKYED
ncbi:MAG: beta-ketoacyl-[acyl-carrier-protein] synthase I [Micavibrio sp. TMED27]|nr:beta-ketoacyl-[acyl-carrier-protein] synthase I [Micavibrio sp.]OUT92012.1 MAG: beta-ketoacyl-[acyl-carrier-protein] synthase I [Micavibrio sp. TMED27]|tara:strand:- start:680 stop:1909 length:1230 start_codon:yes stop_codon:yes gene_type:complete